MFRDAIEQGFSYAAATQAEYVWATSGDREAHFTVMPHAIMEREKNRIKRIPPFKKKGKPPRKSFQQRFFWIHQRPVLSDTVIFSVVLLISTITLAKITVAYWQDIFPIVEPYWDRFHWNFNAAFNLLAFVAMLLTLGFGRVFMRSHQFYQTDVNRRRLVLLLIALVLFVPVWLIGISNQDPQWWTWQHYYNMDYPILIYLWPYAKAMPLQFLAIYGLIWLMKR